MEMMSIDWREKPTIPDMRLFVKLSWLSEGRQWIDAIMRTMLTNATAARKQAVGMVTEIIAVLRSTGLRLHLHMIFVPSCSVLSSVQGWAGL